MKTLEDLRTLIPVISDKISGVYHQIGESCLEHNEDGWGQSADYSTNYFTYEDDGWYIEITYQCCGEWDDAPGDYWTPPCCELRKAWGEVTGITASHYDEDADEETEFEVQDLTELWDAIDGVLKNIA